METEGFVYVVQMEGHDIYKIGRSVDVPRRMSDFGVLLPFPFRLRFAHRVANAHHVEQSLHRDFHHQKQNGEWFRLSTGQVKWIKAWLLVTQAYEFADYLRSRCASGYTHYEDFEKFGRIFIGTSRRIQRRVEQMHCASAEIVNEDAAELDVILDAEVVA